VLLEIVTVGRVQEWHFIIVKFITECFKSENSSFSSIKMLSYMISEGQNFICSGDIAFYKDVLLLL